MFDKLIKKFKINKASMLKNGTVAVVTMFGVGALFGSQNIMLAFPIALTSTVLGRQNFGVKTISKIIRITLIDLTIVLVAYLSTKNLYLGIPINFLAMFLIMYTIVTPYDPTFYKPFIMLYVFAQYASVSFSELPLRFLSIVFGVMVVLLCNAFISKVNEKNLLGKSVISSLKLIKKQLENIIKNDYDDKLTLDCTKGMMDLAYKIYVTRYKKYLTTNLGQIQFKIFINIEHLNLYVKRLKEALHKNEVQKVDIKELKLALSSIISYSKGEIVFECLEYSINDYINKHRNKSVYTLEVSNILIALLKNIKELSELDDKEINTIYEKWERSDLDRFKVTFKEYFRPNSIRFKFAMRMSLTLTLALFIGELLGFYKVIWAIITIMSIMQPYYEDTISKTKERVWGNILAILFTAIFINIINIRWVTLIVLVIALYLLYGFKEYYKISLFAGIASICVSSLTRNINELLIYRIAYVIVGVIVVMIANKFILPYRLKEGISQLVDKIKRYNTILINEGRQYLDGKEDVNLIRDIIIHSTLMSQKLYLRNLQYNDENIYRFIDENNNFVIEVGYKILMAYGKDEEVKKEKIREVLRLYEEFNIGNEKEVMGAKGA